MEKIIKEYPAYKISKQGKVFSCFKLKTSIQTNEWRELKQVYDKSCGYMIVTLVDGKGKRQNKRVHRLLMEAFVPNPNNYPQINHIDGNKLNNSLSNLEWCSGSHNTRHAISLGLMKPVNEKTVEQYTLNGVFVNEFKSIHEAGRQTGIAWQNISKVCLGKRKSAGKYYWKYK